MVDVEGLVMYSMGVDWVGWLLLICGVAGGLGGAWPIDGIACPFCDSLFAFSFFILGVVGSIMGSTVEVDGSMVCIVGVEGSSVDVDVSAIGSSIALIACPFSTC